jgi:predicted lysophospholipase L1 biosynthesis ABC-type transport system permease subunit
MAEELKKHPILTYLTFVLPMALLMIGIAISANVLLIIITIAWLGIAFIVLFLPIESDNGSSS